jgi:ADP-ribose pyrophosphatase
MKIKSLKSKIIKQTVLWKKQIGSNMFKVFSRVVVRMRPDGTIVDPFNFFVFDRGNSVSALIHIVDLDKIILLRQYRAGSDSYLFEIPAGMIDGDEKPESAVTREVMEETGFGFKKITHLMKVFLSPGGYTESSDIYFVQTSMNLKKTEGGGRFEESEEIEIFYVGADEAIQMMHEGLIVDAKTIIALQWLENKRLSA